MQWFAAFGLLALSATAWSTPVAEAGGGPAPDARAAGQYLAQAGNCFSCHTARGGQPFAGGVPFFTEFGTLYSSNITPSREAGIGSWTEADFARAMRSGIGKDGEHLYPAFPYTAFTKLSDADLHQLFVYLRTLTPVASRPPANEMKFPLNMRLSLTGWKLFFFKEGPFEPHPELNARQNRGAYLVEALGHCSACHSPRNMLGAEASAGYLSGGAMYDYVRNGDIRPWSTANLTPSGSGLKHWSSEDIVRYLKTGYSPRAVAFGPMKEVVANSTRYLSDEDALAIAEYLKSLPAIPSETAAPAAAQRGKAGEMLYSANCGTCHQPTGLGSVKTGPPLSGSAIVLAKDPASLINAILYSPEVSEALPSEVSRPPMPAFEAKLDNDEIAAVATYVRSSWENHAEPVSARQVAAQR
jgi:mono/diheme cytochrome c family protein